MRHFSMYRVLNGRTKNRSKMREIFLLIFLIDRSCEGNVGGERVRARRAGGGERVDAWEWCLRASRLTRCKPSHKMQFASFQLLELTNLSLAPHSIKDSLPGEIEPLRPPRAPRGQ